MSKLILTDVSWEEIKLNDADWADFETAATVSFSRGQRGHVLDLMNAYRQQITLHRNAARPGKVKPVLEGIAAAAGKLGDALARLDDGNVGQAAESYLEFEASKVRERSRGFTDHRLVDLRTAIVWLQMHADGALARLAKRLPDGAAIGDPFEHDLIRRVAAVLVEAAGKGKRKGPHSKSGKAFLAAVCLRSGAEPSANGTFDETIRKAVGKKPGSN